VFAFFLFFFLKKGPRRQAAGAQGRDLFFMGLTTGLAYGPNARWPGVAVPVGGAATARAFAAAGGRGTLGPPGP